MSTTPEILSPDLGTRIRREKRTRPAREAWTLLDYVALVTLVLGLATAIGLVVLLFVTFHPTF